MIAGFWKTEYYCFLYSFRKNAMNIQNRALVVKQRQKDDDSHSKRNDSLK